MSSLSSPDRSRSSVNQPSTPPVAQSITVPGRSRSNVLNRNPEHIDPFNNDTTTANSPSSTSRSRSTTQGITVTKRSHARNPRSTSSTSQLEPSFETSFEEGFSLYAFGDLSMSEAYNAPAPTTGEYPLRLKRTRPPKASKKHLQLGLGRDGREDGDGGEDEDGCMENILQHLYTPDYPLSPASDFKRFVEGLQSAKVASHASTRMAGVSVSKRTQAQARSSSGVKTSMALRGHVDLSLSAKSSSAVATQSSSVAVSKAMARSTTGHRAVKARA